MANVLNNLYQQIFFIFGLLTAEKNLTLIIYLFIFSYVCFLNNLAVKKTPLSVSVSFSWC